MRLQRPQAQGCKMGKSGAFKKDSFAGGYFNVASRYHQFEKYLKESRELWLLSASRCLGRYPHHQHSSARLISGITRSSRATSGTDY